MLDFEMLKASETLFKMWHQ